MARNLSPPVARLFDRLYPLEEDGRRSRDGTLPFYDWILSDPAIAGGTVLNVGAGPTPLPAERRMRDRVGRLVGADVSEEVNRNEDLHEAHVFDGIHLPFGDSTFDGAYSDWTIEHVEHPAELLADVRRVLKPGASFWFRTPNVWHYAYAFSRFTPMSVHNMLYHRVQALRSGAHDAWPTYYRANSPRQVRRVVLSAGFRPPEIRLVESFPGYLMFNPLAFLLGAGYERAVNSTSALAALRAFLLVRATR